VAWWVIQNVVIAAALAVIVQVICRVGRFGPVARHALWVVVLVKLLTPPLVVWPWAVPMDGFSAPDPMQRVNAVPTAGGPNDATDRVDGAMSFDPTRSAPFLEPSQNQGDAPARPERSEPARQKSGPAIVAWLAGQWRTVWIAGAIAFGLTQLVRVLGIRRKLQGARAADAALTRRVEMCARRLGIEPISIKVVPGILSPLIWAAPRPVLLWPDRLMPHQSNVCLDGLVLHELAHVKRRDHWIGWLELAAGCAWWWNPLFWYVRAQLREYAELSCDAWVIDALPHGRRAYAEALLAVCASFPRDAAPMLAVGISTGNRRVLERRLIMIMRDRVSLRLSKVGVISTVLLTLAVLPAWAQRTATTAVPTADQRPVIMTVPPSQPIVAVPMEVRPEVMTVTIPKQTPRPRIGNVQANAALPEDAKKLIDQFNLDQERLRKELDAKVALQRADLIKKLQALQESETKAGHLDEALAIRTRIRQLESGVEWYRGFATAEPSLHAWNTGYALTSFNFRRSDLGPSNLAGYRARAGETLTFAIVGSDSGPVWGTDVYTDDSALAAAAVHAGAVANGRLGCVSVKLLPRQDGYKGATRHDLTSGDFASWPGSFSVTRADSCTIEITGSTTGHVWGTDVYSDDSTIAAAAVHAGILKAGERGSVKITILPGRDHYDGSTKNGITSGTYGTFGGSFRLERVK
jgi:beta-lactamase regulating signal transducer with metallopeptidase domain